MRIISTRVEHGLVGVLLIAFVVLAIGFSLGPIFEGPDEIEHYRYIRAIAETGRLPDAALIQQYDEGAWGEFHQPLLYYVFAAPLVRLLGDDGFRFFEERQNPYYGYRFEVSGNDNKNAFLHTRAEQFPYSESALARTVHIIRLLSVAFGAATALVCYAIARLLWPDRPGRRLLALSAAVFMPQFLYMSSVVTNDALSYLLITLSLYLLLRQVRDGPSLRRARLLGVLMGLALLTKLSAGFMIFPAAAATLLDRRTWPYATLTVGVVVLVAGWWYVRNWALYGDPTGVEILFSWSAPSEKIGDGSLALDIGLQRFGFAYETFWARFGGGSVAVSDLIYRFFDVLTVLTLAGAGVKVAKAFSRRVSPLHQRYGIVMVVFGLSWLAAALYWASRVWSGNQGRFLLPGIAAWSVLIAFGLDAWTPRQIRRPMTAAMSVLLGVVAFISLFGYYLPAYAISSVPETIARPVTLRFGVAELIGMAPAAPRARPGDTVSISLFWRAIHPSDRLLQSYLHSVGSDVVRRDSIPATGNLLSTDWREGQTWAEHYTVTIPSDATPQRTYPLIAGLYDPDAGVPLVAEDVHGNPATPIVGRIAINGPEAPGDPDSFFGDTIGLLDVMADVRNGGIESCMTWIALEEVDTDYSLTVRLETEGGELIEQMDRSPRAGDYPTGAWAKDERIYDCLMITPNETLPEFWRIRFGLYDPANLERLPVRDRSGHTFPDALVTITPARANE